jgi:hypothetical protein
MSAKTILDVEDSELNRKIIRDLLRPSVPGWVRQSLPPKLL